VLHSFKGTKTDGAYPRAGLLYANGTLYGTTSSGGNGLCEGCGNHEHFGTVFEITPSGKEKLIYKFRGYPNDGAVPGELMYDNGTFYGTTVSGGANCAVSHGCETIFSITPSGSEGMLYSFLPRERAEPVAGLVDVGGTLYGTTPDGRYVRRGNGLLVLARKCPTRVFGTGLSPRTGPDILRDVSNPRRQRLGSSVVEQGTHKPLVVGSSPTRAKTKTRPPLEGGRLHSEVVSDVHDSVRFLSSSGRSRPNGGDRDLALRAG
jgi:uncharacterized repeat protein (TIGR03803 family)